MGPTLAFERAGEPLHLALSQKTEEGGNFSAGVAQIKFKIVKIMDVKHLFSTETKSS